VFGGDRLVIRIRSRLALSSEGSYDVKPHEDGVRPPFRYLP
jgi:hypothetical protein